MNDLYWLSYLNKLPPLKKMLGIIISSDFCVTSKAAKSQKEVGNQNNILLRSEDPPFSYEVDKHSQHSTQESSLQCPYSE